MEDWTSHCSGHCLLSGIKYSKTIHQRSCLEIWPSR